MNMSVRMFAVAVLVAGFASASALAEDAAPTPEATAVQKDRSKMTLEERREANRRDRAEWRKKHPRPPTGGILERPTLIPSSVISVVNKQGLVPGDVLPQMLAMSRRACRLPIVLAATNRVAITIELVESDAFGALAIYPEDNRATVNVKPLAADGATGDLLATRLYKEIIRAALMTLGSGYSPTLCHASVVRSLKDLDQINPKYVSPDTFTHLGAMPLLGMQFVTFSNYREACKQGWAPAPTNDVQRGIWDEIHNPPSKPLKIEFDPVTQKGKVTK